MSSTLVYKCDGCGCVIESPAIHGSIWREELRLVEGSSDFHACNYTCFLSVLNKLMEKAKQALSRIRIS